MLAHAMARLLDDPNLRETLGRGARKRIERHYSVASVADVHAKSYGELLAKKNAKKPETS